MKDGKVGKNLRVDEKVWQAFVKLSNDEKRRQGDMLEILIDYFKSKKK